MSYWNNHYQLFLITHTTGALTMPISFTLYPISSRDPHFLPIIYPHFFPLGEKNTFLLLTISSYCTPPANSLSIALLEDDNKLYIHQQLASSLTILKQSLNLSSCNHSSLKQFGIIALLFFLLIFAQTFNSIF